MAGLNRRKATVVLSVAGGAGLLALALAVPAFAQDPGATPSPSASASGSASGSAGQPGGKGDHEAKHAERQAALAEALGKELGIDKEKVVAALAKVEADQAANRPKPDGTRPNRAADLKTRLAQAVAEGKLTQAEADAITKASESGILPGR